MQNISSYQKYIENRTSALENFSKINFSTKSFSDPSSIKAYYQDLTKEIFSREMNVTNIDNHEKEYFGLKYFSLYQRQGHSLLNENIYHMLYDENTKVGTKAFAYFTSSCQMTHFALFYFLNQTLGGLNVQYPTERIYFETKSIIDQDWVKKSSADKCIYFLDSGFLKTRQQLLDFQHKKVSMLIFDTTCFDRQSEEIRLVVELALKLSVPLIMTRSHLKLDSLGVEYGSLGSILFFNCDEQEFVKKVALQISLMGAFAPIKQVYPFLFNQEFKDVTTERTNMIRNNCQQMTKNLEAFLKQSGLGLELYMHDLHLIIIYQSERLALLKLGKIFLKLCHMNNIEGRFCDSFGFDFFSLTNFGRCDNSGRGYLRFCPPVNPDEVKAATTAIRLLLKNVAENEA